MKYASRKQFRITYYDNVCVKLFAIFVLFIIIVFVALDAFK